MGRICLLENLIMNRSHFDKLYIIGHTGGQNEVLKMLIGVLVLSLSEI